MMEARNSLDEFRVRVFLMVVGGVLMVFLLRLLWLQVVEGPALQASAAENRRLELNLPAPRGIILDRNGTVLARNAPSYNIVITPAYLPDDPGDIQEIYRGLSELTGIPVNQGDIEKDTYTPCVPGLGIRQMVIIGGSIAPYRPVKIQCDVAPEVARIVQEKAMDWPGVGVEIGTVREYPTGELTANVVGFLGPVPATQVDYYESLGLDPTRDKVGYAGVELSMQEVLAGHNGRRVVEVDVAGKVLRDLEPPVPAAPGDNVLLTIDVRLQNAARAILINELQTWNQYLGYTLSDNGVVIAMNPKTGEILAMVSYPSYENNRMSRFIPAYYWQQLQLDAHKPLLNHAVGIEQPPGSVFKLATAVGGLNEGVVAPDQVIQTPGTIQLTQKYYAKDPGSVQTYYDWNWEKGGFGQLVFPMCIANSSNICFYKIGGGYFDEIPNGGLGICRLGAYAYALGYGQRSGIELPDETDGLIPTPKWKRIFQGENWATGDTYLAAVGQGYVLATPLQVLQSAATIATGGRRMRPTVIYQVRDGEGNVVQPFQPQLIWDITQDPVIEQYFSEEWNPYLGGCRDVPHESSVQPWVLDVVRQGMRRAVTEGTLKKVFEGSAYRAAGKTGTAEYCDDIANAKGLCTPGQWPRHAWTVAYAPFDDPEIVVVAFVYNGGEGASVAGPIVRRVLDAYFEIKAADAGR